jgi:hypothetical protein
MDLDMEINNPQKYVYPFHNNNKDNNNENGKNNEYGSDFSDTTRNGDNNSNSNDGGDIYRGNHATERTTTTVFTEFPGAMDIDTIQTTSCYESPANRKRKSKEGYMTSLLDLQKKYRRKTLDFFHNKGNYERLQEFIHHRDQRIFSILLFFIIRYKPNDLCYCQRTYETGPENNADGKPVFFFHRPKDEYTRALKKYKKRFYNFEDKVGTGDLVWENIRNPRFLVSPENGPISLPLAKVIALYWTIQYGFDTVFWEKYTNILTTYEAFTQKTKKRYTEAHKIKKQKLRSEIETQVIAERDKVKAEEENKRLKDPSVKRRRQRDNNKKNNRRKTRLSREMRKKVTEMIQVRKDKIKEQTAKKDKTGRKRRRTPTNTNKLATTIHFNPPSLEI